MKSLKSMSCLNFGIVLFSAILIGCSDPCEEYCEVGIDRIDECQVLNVVNRDREVETCITLLEDEPGDVCDQALASIEFASCERIAEIYCPNIPPSAVSPACNPPP
jgi:hypothetical protein